MSALPPSIRSVAPRAAFLALAAGLAAALTLAAPAAHAQATSKLKQCADQWNEMKEKNQTGNQTYSQFSKQCMGTGDSSAAKPADTKPADTKPESKPAATTTAKPAPEKPAAKPAAAEKPKPTQAAAKKDADEEGGTDKEDLARCNASWKDYKAKHDATGAKAWHVFMARCLP